MLGNKAPTSIEVAMIEALTEAKIGHVFQHPIYSSNKAQVRFTCDFGFPGTRLIVECDGDYWHSLPNAQRNDRRKNAYLKAAGYTVLRFTETEIKRDVGACVQAVQAALSTAAAAAS